MAFEQINYLLENDYRPELNMLTLEHQDKHNQSQYIFFADVMGSFYFFFASNSALLNIKIRFIKSVGNGLSCGN